VLLFLTACGGTDPAPTVREEAPEAQAVPATPPAPGQPGEFADDRTPLREGPGQPGGAQDAATVAETYYALIEAGKYRDAWKLRWPAQGDDAEAFAANFEKYASYHVNVGAPAEPQAAAGSFYVEVPVQIYGQLRSGEPFSSAGSITLRRSNDAGATAAQREWRIYGGG
jgi:hypothetical protein